VHVYADGSVLVAHGGTEMGQGLYTKVIQVAAQVFGISENFIITAETSTNTVANASPTAASASTDLYGMAVLSACEEINLRLAPLRAARPGLDWAQLVNAAFFDRIDLSAHGFYTIDTERCGYDWDMDTKDNSKRGLPFNYFTTGVAVSEVEIDCLTGDSRIVRADILMDVGKSINPALDIGQIEGAFMQGYGWSTMEEMIWGDSDHPWVRPGHLFTKGPGTYKIPAFNDVPADFRLHLSDTHNPFAVHSSKAIGEPPFFLGASVFWAIKVRSNSLCCMPYAVCCMLYAVCCMPYALCLLSYAVCRMPYAVCRMPYAVCRLRRRSCTHVCRMYISSDFAGSDRRCAGAERPFRLLPSEYARHV
jgi:xanthine dehydrogenase/oxidase